MCLGQSLQVVRRRQDPNERVQTRPYFEVSLCAVLLAYAHCRAMRVAFRLNIMYKCASMSIYSDAKGEGNIQGVYKENGDTKSCVQVYR